VIFCEIVLVDLIASDVVRRDFVICRKIPVMMNMVGLNPLTLSTTLLAIQSRCPSAIMLITQFSAGYHLIAAAVTLMKISQT
jgi:hypothetical protein